MDAYSLAAALRFRRARARAMSGPDEDRYYRNQLALTWPTMFTPARMAAAASAIVLLACLI